MKAALKDSLKSAMKAQDRLRLETIRALLTEIQYEEMQKAVEELSAAECTVIFQREVKKRQEAMQFEEQAGRQEAKEKLAGEIRIIEEFLPKQMTPEQLEKIILEFKSSTPGAALPLVMKHLKEKFAGQYDGKSASEIAKRVLG